MKNRNNFFPTDIRKNGYLLVGRSELKALYSEDNSLRRIAHVLLCVQTFAYFRAGQVEVKGKMYFCRPGDWITTFAVIADLTGLDRRTVKQCLLQLEKYGILYMEDLPFCKRIVLQGPDFRQPADSSGPPSAPAMAPSGLQDLIAGADAYYSNHMQQEGGVN